MTEINVKDRFAPRKIGGNNLNSARPQHVVGQTRSVSSKGTEKSGKKCLNTNDRYDNRTV